MTKTNNKGVNKNECYLSDQIVIKRIHKSFGSNSLSDKWEIFAL